MNVTPISIVSNCAGCRSVVKRGSISPSWPKAAERISSLGSAGQFLRGRFAPGGSAGLRREPFRSHWRRPDLAAQRQEDLYDGGIKLGADGLA